jgi:YD repeat-containing protein
MSVTNNSLLYAGESFIKRFGYDVSNNLIYEGSAVPGTATSAAAWAIRKYTYDGSGNATGINWAGGNTLMVNIWDNAASLSYS